MGSWVLPMGSFGLLFRDESFRFRISLSGGFRLFPMIHGQLVQTLTRMFEWTGWLRIVVGFAAE